MFCFEKPFQHPLIDLNMIAIRMSVDSPNLLVSCGGFIKEKKILSPFIFNIYHVLKLELRGIVSSHLLRGKKS